MSNGLFDSTAKKLEEQAERCGEDNGKLEDIALVMGSLAHDFNNVIGVIGGAFSSMKNMPLDQADFSKKLDFIGSCVERLSELNSELSSFCRGTNEPLVEIDFKIIIAEAVEQALIGYPDCDFQFDLSHSSDQLPGHNIKGYAGRIKSAVVQLLRNAAQHHRDDSPIWVRIKESVFENGITCTDGVKLPSGAYFCIEIEDGGAGIAEHEIDQVFKPLFTTRSAEDALGLGLNIAKRAMKMHSGAVDLEVKEGSDSGVIARLFFSSSV